MTDTPIRHCTVTVSGDLGCGKSTLISILAQALTGAGHEVSKPDHIKNASQAISDLHHKFQVHFVEAEPAAFEALETADVLAETDERLQSALDRLDEERADHAKIVASLTEQNEALRARLARYPSPQEAADRVNKAITYIHDAAVLDADRARTNRQIEDLKTASAKMRRESEARINEATRSLLYCMTGELRPAPTPSDIQTQRRAAAAQLSAADKLALANGAQPNNPAEAAIAALATPTMGDAVYGSDARQTCNHDE